MAPTILQWAGQNGLPPTDAPLDNLLLSKSSRPTRDARVSEQAFRILLEFRRNVMRIARLNDRHLRRTGMKKLGIALAALGAIIIAAPSIASAETFVIKRGGYH